MKHLLTIAIVFVLALTCHKFPTYAQEARKSPAVQFLEANDGIKGAKCVKVDGFMMRVVRPTLKKTPLIAIMDDIDCFYMFSFKEDRESEERTFVRDAERALNSYMMASEVKDDISHMKVYLDQPDGDACHEMVLLITWPKTSMMVFHGQFTESSLRKMEEISKKQRKEKSEFHKSLYRNPQIPD